MIVLDYLKKTHNNAIIVPPFHTGHLGLLPDANVNIGLVSLPSGAQHCELYITPYEYSEQAMAHLHCTMLDRPGVVQRLFDAIYLLGVNIELQESSAINQINHHSINLLIDWTRSAFLPNESTVVQRQRYSKWQSLFPIKEERYVRLFESIIAHCGHLLVWEEMCHSKFPRLYIRPLGGHHVRSHRTAVVQRCQDHRLHVQIPIPIEILGELHNRLGTNRGNEFQYILLSDTEERVLRVFFPNPDLIPRIVHLGFHHNDLPGALATITRLLAAEKFNILTSLLRKTSSRRSVWEAVLEYRGSQSLPIQNHKSQAEWVAERMSVHALSKEMPDFSKFELEVGLPLYPKPRSGSAQNTKVKGSGKPLDESIQTHEITDILRTQIDQACALFGIGDPEVTHLLNVVQSSIKKEKPSIFLSFPHIAQEHAKLLIQALKEYFTVLIYEPQGAEIITEGVYQTISQADYFIGIWHHDEDLPTGNGYYGISPWMPFEYGIASALGKPSMVIHSNRLDERIWKRINPGIHNPDYTDLHFKTDIIQKIVDHCRQNFH